MRSSAPAVVISVAVISVTPEATATAATRTALGVRRPSSGRARAATIKGCSAPIVAAGPPGSRYAATNRSGKNAPILSMDDTIDFHHQAPVGSVRANATSSSPAGSARAAAASSGRSGGSSKVVAA